MVLISVNQVIRVGQQRPYDCRKSHCAYHSMDRRIGKKLIFSFILSFNNFCHPGKQFVQGIVATVRTVPWQLEVDILA